MERHIETERGTCFASPKTEAEISFIQLELEAASWISQTAQWLEAVKDPTLFKLLYLLYRYDQQCGCDLANILNASNSAVSQHLRNLRDMNLVSSYRHKKTLFYTLSQMSLWPSFPNSSQRDYDKNRQKSTLKGAFMLPKTILISAFLLGFLPLSMAQNCKPTKGCDATAEKKPSCCSVAAVNKEAALPDMPKHVMVLQNELTNFVAAFNQHTSKPRFVAILSPTCKDCVIGAQAIQRHIIEAYPNLDMDILLVWSPVIPSDAAASVLAGIKNMTDLRIKHIWDADVLLGKEFKKHLPLGQRSFAWDIYLFFGKDAEWREKPPEADSWSHQLDALGKEDAAPQFLAVGEKALAKSFQASIEKLLL